MMSSNDQNTIDRLRRMLTEKRAENARLQDALTEAERKWNLTVGDRDACLGELAKAIAEFEYRDGNIRDVIKEAVQTATLCLKIADMVGNEKVPSEIEIKMKGKR